MSKFKMRIVLKIFFSVIFIAFVRAEENVTSTALETTEALTTENIIEKVSRENGTSVENKEEEESSRPQRSIGKLTRLLLGGTYVMVQLGQMPSEHPLVRYPEPIHTSKGKDILAAIPGKIRNAHIAGLPNPFLTSSSSSRGFSSQPPWYHLIHEGEKAHAVDHPQSSLTVSNSQNNACNNYYSGQAESVHQTTYPQYQAHPPSDHAPGPYELERPEHYHAGDPPNPTPTDPYHAAYSGGGRDIKESNRHDFHGTVPNPHGDHTAQSDSYPNYEYTEEGFDPTAEQHFREESPHAAPIPIQHLSPAHQSSQVHYPKESSAQMEGPYSHSPPKNGPTRSYPAHDHEGSHGGSDPHLRIQHAPSYTEAQSYIESDYQNDYPAYPSSPGRHRLPLPSASQNEDPRYPQLNSKQSHPIQSSRPTHSLEYSHADPGISNFKPGQPKPTPTYSPPDPFYSDPKYNPHGQQNDPVSTKQDSEPTYTKILPTTPLIAVPVKEEEPQMKIKRPYLLDHPLVIPPQGFKKNPPRNWRPRPMQPNRPIHPPRFFPPNQFPSGGPMPTLNMPLIAHPEYPPHNIQVRPLMNSNYPHSSGPLVQVDYPSENFRYEVAPTPSLNRPPTIQHQHIYHYSIHPINPESHMIYSSEDIHSAHSAHQADKAYLMKNNPPPPPPPAANIPTQDSHSQSSNDAPEHLRRPGHNRPTYSNNPRNNPPPTTYPSAPARPTLRITHSPPPTSYPLQDSLPRPENKPLRNHQMGSTPKYSPHDDSYPRLYNHPVPENFKPSPTSNKPTLKPLREKSSSFHNRSRQSSSITRPKSPSKNYKPSRRPSPKPNYRKAYSKTSRPKQDHYKSNKSKSYQSNSKTSNSKTPKFHSSPTSQKNYRNHPSSTLKFPGPVRSEKPSNRLQQSKTSASRYYPKYDKRPTSQPPATSTSYSKPREQFSDSYYKYSEPLISAPIKSLPVLSYSEMFSSPTTSTHFSYPDTYLNAQQTTHPEASTAEIQIHPKPSNSFAPTYSQSSEPVVFYPKISEPIVLYPKNSESVFIPQNADSGFLPTKPHSSEISSYSKSNEVSPTFFISSEALSDYYKQFAQPSPSNYSPPKFSISQNSKEFTSFSKKSLLTNETKSQHPQSSSTPIYTQTHRPPRNTTTSNNNYPSKYHPASKSRTRQYREAEYYSEEQFSEITTAASVLTTTDVPSKIDPIFHTTVSILEADDTTSYISNNFVDSDNSAESSTVSLY